MARSMVGRPRRRGNGREPRPHAPQARPRPQNKHNANGLTGIADGATATAAGVAGNGDGEGRCPATSRAGTREVDGEGEALPVGRIDGVCDIGGRRPWGSMPRRGTLVPRLAPPPERAAERAGVGMEVSHAGVDAAPMLQTEPGEEAGVWDWEQHGPRANGNAGGDRGPAHGAKAVPPPRWAADPAARGSCGLLAGVPTGGCPPTRTLEMFGFDALLGSPGAAGLPGDKLANKPPLANSMTRPRSCPKARSCAEISSADRVPPVAGRGRAMWPPPELRTPPARDERRSSKRILPRTRAWSTNGLQQ